MKFFISHIHEESAVAEALKNEIEVAVPGSSGWVSSTDIGTGRAWFSQLDEAIRDATHILILVSPESVSRPWINFEAGGGWGRSIDVLPVCHQGMSSQLLPHPLSALQSFHLYTPTDLAALIDALSDGPVSVADDAWPRIEHASQEVDYVPRALQPLRDPVAESSVLIDLSHGQRSWHQARRGTLFDLALHDEPPSAARDLVDLDVAAIESRDQIRASDLRQWHGMMLAMPWRASLSATAIDQIVEWVHLGGRLGLLGFELGDLHHSGNLNALASRFGLRFQGDMVAPHGWHRQLKPYGAPVEFTAPASPSHPILDGVGGVTWRNVQTLAREPGTRLLLAVGENVLTVPEPESVSFASGLLTMPNPVFAYFDDASWLPVMAEATPHLTGEGRVVAMGTWQLLPDAEDSRDDTNTLFSNLLKWLGGGVE